MRRCCNQRIGFLATVLLTLAVAVLIEVSTSFLSLDVRVE